MKTLIKNGLLMVLPFRLMIPHRALKISQKGAWDICAEDNNMDTESNI